MFTFLSEDKAWTKSLLKTISLGAICGLLMAADSVPLLVESLYSNTIYPILSQNIRRLSGLFSFAIGDILYGVILLFTLFKISFYCWKNWNNKPNWKFGINKFVQLSLSFFIVFKLIWGLNYGRRQLSQTLYLDNKPYNQKELLALANLFASRLDSLTQIIQKHNIKFENNQSYLLKSSTAAYKQLAKTYPMFTYRHASIKPVLNSTLISNMGIEGYYNPLSGEANINMKLPNFVLPFVTCHEIAHQLGIAKEDEANLVGFLAAVYSEDIRFQYAAYYNMFRSILLELRLKYPHSYLEFRPKISKDILKKFEVERQFWTPYNGMMANYMSASFDKLLKLNGQEKGIDSYQDIVLWLYNYYKKRLSM